MDLKLYNISYNRFNVVISELIHSQFNSRGPKVIRDWIFPPAVKSAIIVRLFFQYTNMSMM